MRIRPKYIAVTTFRCRGHRFEPGDPVTDPLVLNVVLARGDRFVAASTAARAPEFRTGGFVPALVLPPDPTGGAGDDPEGDQS
jgi:hypothetical protein